MAEETAKEQPAKTEPAKEEAPKAEAAKPAASTGTTASSNSGGGSSALKIILIIIAVLVILGLGGCLAAGWVAKKAVDKGVNALQQEAEQIQADLGSIEALAE